MITLWGRPNSGNVKKVLWTLAELNLTYDNIPLGGAFGGLDDPQYRRLNPNGRVPTLRDGELVLWESNTIVRYLAAQYGRDNLWIEDCGKRAQAEKWMDWTTATLNQPFRDILFNAVRRPPAERKPDELVKGIRDFESGLAILETELADNLWLSGEHFGVGDIIAGVFVYYYYEIAISRNAAFERTRAWYDRLKARPAYAKYVMTPIK